MMYRLPTDCGVMIAGEHVTAAWLVRWIVDAHPVLLASADGLEIRQRILAACESGEPLAERDWRVVVEAVAKPPRGYPALHRTGAEPVPLGPALLPIIRAIRAAKPEENNHAP